MVKSGVYLTAMLALIAPLSGCLDFDDGPDDGMGNGEWEMGNGRWGMGNGRCEIVY